MGLFPPPRHLSLTGRIMQFTDYGAELLTIMSLFTGELLKPVLVSMLIALPVSYQAMNTRLENYAFRIHLKPVLFILAMLTILVMSIAAISYHVIKLSKVNLAETIRGE